MGDRYFMAYCVDRDYDVSELESGTAQKLMSFDGSGYVCLCSFVSRELRQEAIVELYDVGVLAWPVPAGLAYFQARCCGCEGKMYLDRGFSEEMVLGQVRNYDDVKQFWCLEGQWVVSGSGVDSLGKE